MKRTTLITAALFLTIGLTAPLSAVTIRLQNGSYLQGDIIKSDTKGLDLKRWDGDGIIYLRWDQLPRDEAERLQHLLNIQTEEPPETEYAKILKIYLEPVNKIGGTVTGVVVEETDQEIVLKKLSDRKEIKVSKEKVFHSETILMNISDVYTPQELYEMAIKKYDLIKAEDNYKLAEYCLKLGLLDKARTLFETAAKLDASYKNRVAQRIKEMNREFVTKEVKKINELLGKNQFLEARAVVEKLKKESSLKSETELQKIISETDKTITEAEKKAGEESSKETRKKVMSEWFKVLNSSLNQVANKLSYADATEYVKNYLLQKINEEVAKNLSMDKTTVEKIWKERTEELCGGKKTASYGDGSFASEVKKPPLAPPPDDIDAYRKYKERERQINEAMTIAIQKNKLITADTWWKKSSLSSKVSWLTAYFAECNLKRLETKTTTCSTCSGEGIIRRTKENELCPRCQGATVDVIVVYY